MLKWQVNLDLLGEGREEQASPTGGCPASLPRTQQLAAHRGPRSHIQLGADEDEYVDRTKQ